MLLSKDLLPSEIKLISLRDVPSQKRNADATLSHDAAPVKGPSDVGFMALNNERRCAQECWQGGEGGLVLLN